MIKIDESVFYYSAYIDSVKEGIDIATTQRLLLSKTFYDVSGQILDEKVDEKLRRNISFLL